MSKLAHSNPAFEDVGCDHNGEWVDSASFFEQFPPEVAFEWAVEDLIAAARLDPSILDQDAVKDTADRLIDAIGARQERLFQ